MIITIINPDVSKCMMNCLHGEYEEGKIHSDKCPRQAYNKNLNCLLQTAEFIGI